MGTDGLQALPEESGAALGGTAVLVGAQVDGGVHELRGKVAVRGDQLHAVEPGPLQPGCRPAEPGHDLRDQLPAERTGHDPEALVGHARGA